MYRHSSLNRRAGRNFSRSSSVLQNEEREEGRRTAKKRTQTMIQRVDIPVDPNRSKNTPGDGTDGYSPLPGELVATEKAEEVLDTIDLPVTDSEEPIELSPEELETA